MTINAVLQAYGQRPSWWLSDMTHREDPWKDARGDLPLDASSNATITLDAMRSYYSSAESRERMIVLSFGQPQNPLVAFMQQWDDEDGELLDELSDFDELPEIATLTALVIGPVGS